MNRNRIPLATAGLLVTWMVHDLEELLTMSDTSRTLVQQLPDWIPVPGSIREQGLTTRYLATGIATIGLIVAAAAVRGYRTQGRSAFYQNTLLAFGLHGLGHLAASLVTWGLHQWCRHRSDGRCVLAVGDPCPRRSRRYQPTLPSGRDRTARRLPRRRPFHRLPPHRKPALNNGDKRYWSTITLPESA